MTERCGATYAQCVCSNPVGCDGTTHQCTRDGCRGEWTYDHEGEPVPVTLCIGVPVPDEVLAFALRQRFLNEAKKEQHP